MESSGGRVKFSSEKSAWHADRPRYIRYQLGHWRKHYRHGAIYQSSSAIRALVVSRELAIPTELIFPHIKIIRIVSECFSEVECSVHHSWQRKIVAVLCILLLPQAARNIKKTYIIRGMWINAKWTKIHAERVWTCEKAWFLFCFCFFAIEQCDMSSTTWETQDLQGTDVCIHMVEDARRWRIDDLQLYIAIYSGRCGEGQYAFNRTSRKSF